MNMDKIMGIKETVDIEDIKQLQRNVKQLQSDIKQLQRDVKQSKREMLPC